MSILSTEYGLGTYLANEGHLLIRTDSFDRDQGLRGIIAIHGHGASATVWTPGNFVGDHALYLAKGGNLVLSIDAAGPATWANDACMSAIDSAFTYLTTTLGCLSDKVGVMGWSMGGLAAMNWLKRNPSKVTKVVVWAPGLNIDYFYDNNPTSKTEIDAAYGGSGHAQYAGHNPQDDAASYSGLGVPVHIYQGTADSTVPPSQATAFIAAVNDSNYVLHSKTGAGHATIFNYVPVTETLRNLAG